MASWLCKSSRYQNCYPFVPPGPNTREQSYHCPGPTHARLLQSASIESAFRIPLPFHRWSRTYTRHHGLDLFRTSNILHDLPAHPRTCHHPPPRLPSLLPPNRLHLGPALLQHAVHLSLAQRLRGAMGCDRARMSLEDQLGQPRISDYYDLAHEQRQRWRQ